MNCLVCNKRAYSEYCVAHKPRKPIQTKTVPKRGKRPKQRGKHSYELSEWVKNVARPYLIATYGEVCNVRGCVVCEALDVDHVINKGSHPELKMSLSNVQFLCRDHHRQKTDGAVLQYKHEANC